VAPIPMTEPTALVFPGQGSQRPGMAAPWRDDPAFALWGRADELLGRNVTRLGLDAGADELREPVNCQVALFVHHAVMTQAWQRTGRRPAAVAGHSLGEYSALLAAGVVSFADALWLVDARARATQAAANAAPGGMVACLGHDTEAVAAACREAGAHVANDNAEGQVVVAGSHEALGGVVRLLAGRSGRVVPLQVGAAYHSPHMAAAVPAFSRAVRRASFAPTRVPVVANVDARPHTDSADWPALLTDQLTAPVRWRETVMTLTAMGVTTVVELGASPVLTGLVKRVAPETARTTVSAPDHLAVAA